MEVLVNSNNNWKLAVPSTRRLPHRSNIALKYPHTTTLPRLFTFANALFLFHISCHCCNELFKILSIKRCNVLIETLLFATYNWISNKHRVAGCRRHASLLPDNRDKLPTIVYFENSFISVNSAQSTKYFSI